MACHQQAWVLTGRSFLRSNRPLAPKNSSFLTSTRRGPSSTAASFHHLTCPPVFTPTRDNARIVHDSVVASGGRGAYFSSEASSSPAKSPGIFQRIKNSLDGRAEQRQSDQFVKQMEKMASQDTWSLGDFASELDTALGGWRSKIPGMGNLAQVKSIKESQKIVNAVVDEMGRDANIEAVQHLGRKEKLKMSLKSGVSLEDINMLVQQCQSMWVMHRVLRYRKLHGKSIPKDEASMKAALQADGAMILKPGEKKAMQKKRSMRSMSGTGRRR